MDLFRQKCCQVAMKRYGAWVLVLPFFSIHRAKGKVAGRPVYIKLLSANKANKRPMRITQFVNIRIPNLEKRRIFVIKSQISLQFSKKKTLLRVFFILLQDTSRIFLTAVTADATVSVEKWKL